MPRIICRLWLLLCIGSTSLGSQTLVAVAGVLPKDSAEQYELTFWESIKGSRHVGDYDAYLQAYPKGRFTGLARARVERLRGGPYKSRPRDSVGARDSTPQVRAAALKSGTPPAAPAHSEKVPAALQDETAAPSKAAVSTITETTDCKTCPIVIGLPAGVYTMGSNSSDPTEQPAFRVTISQPFAIGKYEVTIGQWSACVDAGACPRVTSDTERPANGPVRDVSWDDVHLYLAWLSKVSGKAYRLPTEAEWEYAARGGTSTRYWWGQQMATGKSNCKECGEPWQAEAPAKVGSFERNPFGLYDMNGSVWEWVSDCWHSSYQRAPSDGRSWEEPDCRVRVLRGGSWREGASYMPSSTRFKYDASVRQSQNGFRVARDVSN